MATLDIIPNGDGYYEACTTTPDTSDAYTCIDDPVGTPDNSASEILSLSGTLKNSFVFSDIAITGSITNLTVYFRCFKRGGASTARAFLRISGTDYFGDTKTLTTSYANYSQVWSINPATSGAWSIADINACEFGIELYAVDAKNSSRCTQLYGVVTYTEKTVAGASLLL